MLNLPTAEQEQTLENDGRATSVVVFADVNTGFGLYCIIWINGVGNHLFPWLKRELVVKQSIIVSLRFRLQRNDIIYDILHGCK
jgi:hypothetical protein